MKNKTELTQSLEQESIKKLFTDLNTLGTVKAQHDYNSKVMFGRVKI